MRRHCQWQRLGAATAVRAAAAGLAAGALVRTLRLALPARVAAHTHKQSQMTERSAREHEGKKEEKEGGKEQEKRGFYSVFTPPMGTPVSERRLRRGACGGLYFEVQNPYFAASPQSTCRMP